MRAHHQKLPRKEFKRRAMLNAKLDWRTLPYEEFILLAEVPLPAQALVQRIRSRCPNARFVVEFTEPTEVVKLDQKLWAWKPDPVLRVNDGTQSFPIYVWDEEGFKVPAKRLH